MHAVRRAIFGDPWRPRRSAVSSTNVSGGGSRSSAAAMRRRIEQLERNNRRLESELAALSLKDAASTHAAGHDALTGLPNRTLMLDRFRQATAHADRHRNQLALLFIDLDDFKRVNDGFGHLAGDRVLQLVANRIQAMVRATDTVCRYGGDEFVVLLGEIGEGTAFVDVAGKIRTRIAEPYAVEAATIGLDCTHGMAVYPSDGAGWEALMAHADAAMYRAKPSRRTAPLQCVSNTG